MTLLRRASLGPDLVIVSLVMEEEDVRGRLVDRHPGQDSVVKMLMVKPQSPQYPLSNFPIIALFTFQNINQLCLDPGQEEDRVVVVNVDQKKTREDVVDEILKKIVQ